MRRQRRDGRGGAREENDDDDDGYTDAIATAITRRLRPHDDKRMETHLLGLTDALVRIESVEGGGKDFHAWARDRMSTPLGLSGICSRQRRR